jgi:prepilin-type processing-associated H-X9-DG protein
MKLSHYTAQTAFTRRDLLVVLVMVGLWGVLYISGLDRAKQKKWRIQCANNLKQVGLAVRTFAIDNGGEFLGTTSTNGGAALGAMAKTQAFQYFQVWSNLIGSPKVLVCPADTRVPAKDFGRGFSNTNISYFVGQDAQETMPQTFLSGDRNLTNGLPIQDGILLLPPDRPVGWSAELHSRQGNVGLADGSVQGFSNFRLLEAVRAGGTTNRLAMP